MLCMSYLKGQFRHQRYIISLVGRTSSGFGRTHLRKPGGHICVHGSTLVLCVQFICFKTMLLPKYKQFNGYQCCQMLYL